MTTRSLTPVAMPAGRE